MAAFNFHDIQVARGVYGASTGILLGTLATKQSRLNSGIWRRADGSVTGGATGITTQGSGISLTNEGTIYGGSYGLSHIGNSAPFDQPRHHRWFGGCALQSAARGALIENHGVITSSEFTASHNFPTRSCRSRPAPSHGEGREPLSGQAAAFYAPAIGGHDVFTTTLLNHGVISGAGEVRRRRRPV